jgi:thioredoxin 1
MSYIIREVSDAEFETTVLKAEKPVLIDFWAPWCGPCKAISPMVTELADQYGERLVFMKCNIDENPELPRSYGIKSIPTLMIFNQGKPVESIIGMVSRNSLEEKIENTLAGKAGSSPFIMH